uniref:Uncharacterized protein n=1 Tax=Anguilla anguilla TaxID=7936 RepID=A0A0E9QBW9_ANGAN
MIGRPSSKIVTFETFLYT